MGAPTRTGRSLLICALGLAGCSGRTGPSDQAALKQSNRALDDSSAAAGQHFFEAPLAQTNGRACATCHIESDHFALTPQHVNALYATNPSDPLFNPIDADDPNAAVLTYDHLKAGLVRITLKLADNLDVIDANGNVITNADRTIFVWRGVPTIENVAYTAPYQYDGRAPTLEVQANGALHAHSQIPRDPADPVLAMIANFERTLFSSQAASDVAAALAAGQAPPPLDVHAPPGSDAAAGQVVFQNICAKCHGTPTTNFIPDQVVFDSFFPVQNPDGTAIIDTILPTGIAVTSTFMTNVPRTHEGTLGISALALLGQLGVLPNPSGLTLPHYRIRFYTDATRTQIDRDMPPSPPGIGPSLLAEPFSVDPGRAIVSGDPIDWEGFDVPQLRGVSKTAPYFHDNSAPDLHALLDEYSRLILPADPVLNMPPIFPPEGPGLPPESMTPTQKAQLFAFLQLL
jgi:mono/diheme cytochrome c family protein